MNHARYVSSKINHPWSYCECGEEGIVVKLEIDSFLIIGGVNEGIWVEILARNTSFLIVATLFKHSFLGTDKF